MITYSGPLVVGDKDDEIRAFIGWGEANGKLKLNEKAAAPTTELYGLYMSFCSAYFTDVMSRESFGRTLVRLGSMPLRGSGGIRMHGGIQITHY